MKKRGHKLSFEQKLSLCGYLLIPIFFVVMYLLMTETYEDIMQANSEANMSVPGIINRIYHYIPRLGEFYQHIAVHFMTAQASLGLDMVFRLVTAAIATGVVYFSTVFILGRKPKLRYLDVSVALGVLLFIMISTFSEAFTYRFSYANNSILGLFVAVAFLVLFRLKLAGDKWWKLLGVLVLGFAFGISTELAPVAFILLIGLWVLVKLLKKELRLSDLFGKYRLQTFATIGLIAGLVFFYVFGGGLGARTGGGYADVYDYVSPMGILHDPVTTVYKLVHHLWYNIRYIFFAIPLMLLFIFVEWTMFKKERLEYFNWQRRLLLFCMLFVGATALIEVHDDLYPRFMVPMFVAIVLSTLMFVRHIIEYAKVPEKTLRRTAIATTALGVVLVADMTFAFALYNRQMAEKLPAVHYNPGGELVIDPIEGSYTMIPSPVFSLKQLPPFDWGPAADYTKFGL